MWSIIALWTLVLFETLLLLLLLRALGEMRQQRGAFPAERVLDVGELAPPLEVTDQDGKAVHLESSQGRYRILAFISPGCTPCTQAITVLNKVYQDESNLVVLVLGSPDREANQEFAAEQHIQVPILTPVPGFVQDRYRIEGVPFVFVLDETGIVRAKGSINTLEHLNRLLKAASIPLAAD